jgi:glutamyl/glutaminyl-tRNA synthetase
MKTVCRFAPSSTGRAHPGTLLAGLLAWLDARSCGAEFILRLEDLDPERSKPEWRDGLLDDLRWFGLDWDRLELQSENASRHAAALDRLQSLQRLYPCSCSRARLKESGQVAADGGRVYPGFCRDRQLAGDWRQCQDPLRCRITETVRGLIDESGFDLSQNIEQAMGDPVLRRRDGAIAYQLAVVVDDAAVGTTRIVRGRDIAASTATQVVLQQLLGLPVPVYRHHLLLLEPRGEKFAKLHGAVGADVLRRHLVPQALCGLLAQVSGIKEDGHSCLPVELVSCFDWRKIKEKNQVLTWTGETLRYLGPAD